MARTIGRPRRAPETEEIVDAEVIEEDKPASPGRRRTSTDVALVEAKTDSPRERSALRRSSKTPAAASSQSATGSLDGWASFTKIKKESASFAESFKPGEEQVLVVFIDDAPFVTFREHWIDELQGRKSRTCLGGLEDCPLCEVGDTPRVRVCFNIIDRSNPINPEVKVWVVGVRLAETIGNFARQTRTSPINREGLSWAVSKTGTKSKTDYSLIPVKDSDLMSDWDCGPLTDDDFDRLAAQASTADKYVREESYDELDEVATDLVR